MVCQARGRYRMPSSRPATSTFVHVQRIPFQEEGKVVEAERHRILKCQKPLRLFNLDAYVDVLGFIFYLYG
jgi:hypothetical protein